MKFDGNRAWNDAVRAVSANREVLLVLAGVFFFLPGLVISLFMTRYEVQMQAALAGLSANPGNPQAMAPLLQLYGQMAPYMIALLVVNSIGYMSMLALLTDRRRPTVREAMAIGARCLPPLVGAILLFALGYLLAMLPLGLILAALMMTLGKGLGVAIGVSLVFVALFWVVARLSLTLPVIVIEALRNPVGALIRSWRITAGNSLRLLGFFLLLFIAYIVIALVLGALVKLVSAPLGSDEIAAHLSGLFSSLIGAAISIALTAVLAAVHRQLAGPSRGAISETFS